VRAVLPTPIGSGEVQLLALHALVPERPVPRIRDEREDLIQRTGNLDRHRLGEHNSPRASKEAEPNCHPRPVASLVTTASGPSRAPPEKRSQGAPRQSATSHPHGAPNFITRGVSRDGTPHKSRNFRITPESASQATPPQKPCKPAEIAPRRSPVRVRLAPLGSPWKSSTFVLDFIDPAAGLAALVNFWSTSARHERGEVRAIPGKEDCDGIDHARPCSRRARDLPPAERQVRGLLAPCRQAAVPDGRLRPRRGAPRAAEPDRGHARRERGGLAAAPLRDGRRLVARALRGQGRRRASPAYARGAPLPA
jgi:hypothetical protein